MPDPSGAHAKPKAQTTSRRLAAFFAPTRVKNTPPRESAQPFVRRHKQICRVAIDPHHRPVSHKRETKQKTRIERTPREPEREFSRNASRTSKTGGCRSANFAGGELTECLGAAISSDAPGKTQKKRYGGRGGGGGGGREIAPVPSPSLPSPSRFF